MRCTLCFFGVLFGFIVGLCLPAWGEPAPPPPKLLEVPPKEARDKLLELVKDVHKKDYLEAKDGAKLSSFATKLLKEGRETRDDSTARFVLFAEALVLAAKANDWNLAFAAIEQMGAEFKVDALDQKARAVGEIGKRLTVPAKQLEMLSTLGELAQQAIAKDRYDVATDLGATATLVARGCGSEAIGQVKARNDKIAELKAAYANVEPVLPVLEKKADDPQANLAFGSFYCFTKGDWDRGLSGLALGADPALKEVATKDLARPAQPEQQLALGDTWWGVAELRTSALEKQNAKQRASYWYTQALPTLSGLTKARVEKRISEAPSPAVLTLVSPPTSAPPPARPVPPRLPPASEAVRPITNSIGMTLVYIPPGEFEMGSPESEAGRNVDETLHRVKLTKGFYLGTTEVTQGQWKAVMQTDPPKGKVYAKEGPTFPTMYVSWDDAGEFCKRLSANEKRSYRLPTEAEWEYACRAGSQSAYSFGDDASKLSDYAWWGGVEGNGNAKNEQYAHAVGQKKANAFGAYDMHGNLWEWCYDWYDEKYYANSAVDPVGPSSGTQRVLRGGSWNFNAELARAARRSKNTPDLRGSKYGFRVMHFARNP